MSSGIQADACLPPCALSQEKTKTALCALVVISPILLLRSGLNPATSFRSPPERAGLAKFIESCKHVHGVLPTVGDPIRVQAFAEIAARKELQQIA